MHHRFFQKSSSLPRGPPLPPLRRLTTTPPAFRRLPIYHSYLARPLDPPHHTPHRSSYIACRYSSVPIANLNPEAHGRTLKPFLLADIGEGITGCEIVKWLVSPGQQVAEFDPIAEVQSDKATVEITSPYEGIIESLVGQPGQVVKVGEPLCMIFVHESQSSQETLQDLKSIEEDRESATKDATQCKKDDTVAATLRNSPTQETRRQEVHSTPSVRRLAHEHELDITKISGTGKEGRVTKEDVLKYLVNPDQNQPSGKPEMTRQTQPSRSTKVSFGAVRQAMFRGMTQSLRIPHFGYYDQLDVTELERVRQELVKNYPGSRITLLSLFVKILGRAMVENELFRSTLSNDDPPQYIQRQTCDISIAVNSPAGLLTPLIPEVESKSVIQIANHITSLRDFINQSSPDKIPRIPDELGGNRSGTVTLSNIGTIGGTYTHPVIPPTGQLAIGGIGSVKVRPEYTASDKALAKSYAISQQAPDRELKIEPRLIVEVSFTADHRAVEGVELAKLVQCFKNYCQSPSLLIAGSI